MNKHAKPDMELNLAGEKSIMNNKGLMLSTANVLAEDRRDWLQEMICQEYARVEITPPTNQGLFNETLLHEWEKLRLSVIRSHGLTLERLPREPHKNSQDNYLAVILVSGHYLMEQDGKEVFLEPGDITIYDATRPHRIYSSTGFSKLIVTVPRAMMRDRLAGVEYCTALQVSGKSGMGAVASSFVQSAARQAENMRPAEFSALAGQSLDLLTLALTSVRPQNFNLSRSRSVSLRLVKDFIERYLADSLLDTAMIATGTHLSARYINDLFRDENTSLMRYVWARRLEKCRKEILSFPQYSVSTIAFRWGFNDLSHFSRAFKNHFGVCPRTLKFDSPSPVS
ncbi:MAG: helix-turn-helix domain-containing protein [Pseudomonadota bacterium]